MRTTPCTDDIGTANRSPSLTRMACVTASVNGSRTVNWVPLPRVESIDSEPPSCLISLHHVHADAAPGDLADRFRGGEAGFQNEAEQVAVGQLRVLVSSGRVRSPCGGSRRDPCRAVVGHLDHDFRRFARHAMLTVPSSFLPLPARSAATRCRAPASCAACARAARSCGRARCGPFRPAPLDLAAGRFLPSSPAVWRIMRRRRGTRPSRTAPCACA
jgi:hypothetical protein